MEHEGDRGFEEDIADLKATLEKWRDAQDHRADDAVAELANVVHRLSDDVVALHRRLEAIENTQHEWTTHGWLPPPGSDSTA
jgi:uncharacterized coiled-coil protein SlyX